MDDAFHSLKPYWITLRARDLASNIGHFDEQYTYSGSVQRKIDLHAQALISKPQIWNVEALQQVSYENTVLSVNELSNLLAISHDNMICKDAN